MELDRLKVVIEGDVMPLSRAFKKGTADAKAFASSMDSIGTSADKSAKQGEAAMSRLSKAIARTPTMMVPSFARS